MVSNHDIRPFGPMILEPSIWIHVKKYVYTFFFFLRVGSMTLQKYSSIATL